MLDYLNLKETQEDTAKPDILHLAPAHPDEGCCCGSSHAGHRCCGRHGQHHGQEPQE